MRVTALLLLAAATLATAAPTMAGDDNQAAELLVAARVALGGEKVDAVKALSATVTSAACSANAR